MLNVIDSPAPGGLFEAASASLTPNASRLFFALDPAEVQFQPDKNNYRGSLDVVFVQETKRGKRVADFKKTLTLTVTSAQLEQLKAKGIRAGQDLELRSDTEAVRIVVLDRTTGIAGSVTIPISPQDKSASLWTLDLVTREVGSFIVGAAQSSKPARELVFNWFDILKGLRRKDMPRTGMRFFMELYGIFGDELSRVNEAWFLWLRYFAANETVGFVPKTRAAVEQLSATIRCLPGTTEQQAAILMLFAEALSYPSEARSRLLVPFIANWVDPASLASAVQAARKLGRSEYHYVSLDDDFLFWAFLHSVKVEGSPPGLVIDLRELRKRAGAGMPMGFADEKDEVVPDDLRCVSAELQPIYRPWSVRETALDKVRPYFTEQTLREKIRPLEIVRTAREERDTIAAPAKPLSVPTLRLKKRGLS